VAGTNGMRGIRMQQLFLVGGKLLGTYFFLDGMIQAVFLASGGNVFPGSNTPLIATLAAQLIVGIVLASFTKPVLAVVGLRDLDQTAPRISPRSALVIGCVLLGLLEFVLNVPRFVRLIDDYRVYGQVSLFPQVIGEGVVLAVSLALVFGARQIAAFIWAANNRRPRAVDPTEQTSAP
jgi:hypothetical protein